MLLASEASGVGLDANFSSPELAYPEGPQRLLVLPDDSFLTYWAFNRFSGQNAGLVLKFRADGTLDPNFRFAGPYYHVIALTPAPGGKFIVAARRHGKTSATYPILRLNGDGTVDEAFDAGAGANRDVYGLAVQPDGKVLVGGTFDSFNGEARQGIVRLESTGTIDSGFAALQFLEDQTLGATGIRTKIIVQPDGKILFGGGFAGINGHARNGVARLNSDGSVDQTFVPTAVRTGTGGHQPIGALELQPDGKVLAAGRFAASGSDFITPLVRMNAEGAVEHYFPGRPNGAGPGTTGRPLGRALKLLNNGDTIVAGDRLYLYSAAGGERKGSQSVAVGGPGLAVDATSDGKILLAGDRIYTVNGGLVGVQRFSAEAVRDTSFNVGEFQREVLPQYIVPRADGEIWVTGSRVRRVNGVRRDGAARLNSDGTLDGAAPDTGTFVEGISFQSDGRYVLFANSFYRRFNADDQVDSTFAYDTTLAPFTALHPASDGKHFVLSYDASAVLQDTVIRQVGDDGIINLSFEIGVKFSEAATDYGSYIVYLGDNRPMASYPDGRFLFRYFDKTGNYRLGRFNSDGSVDSSFQTASVPALVKTESTRTLSDGHHLVIEAAPTVLTDVLLLPDGKIVVVGMFKEFNGVAAPGIARLEADGSVDTSFNPGAGAEWLSTTGDATQLPRIDAIERLADGKLLITGDFEAFDGAPAAGIARLHSAGTRDSSFLAPVRRQFENTAASDEPFAFSPISKLVSEPGGTVLLSGNYIPSGATAARSLIRLTQLTDSTTATRPLNISTRLNVQTGENVLIGGFIITGNAPKKVIVRALGSSLASSGISGALADPMLELQSSGSVIATNDNWKDTQQSAVEASGVAPGHELEPAIVHTLAPGAYTAVVRGKNGGTGVGLIELYDLDQAADAKLANISTRGFVQTDENVMIGGFILGGGGAETNVLVRALGPSLGDNGVSGSLQDPTLELRDNNGELVADNDDWKSTQEAAIRATTIPPTRDEEAAILSSLPTGPYTAIVRGKNATTGVGLVEVYNVQ